ncbi:zinc-binding dehydrogenase, partial [Acinetobacter baumannii]
AYHAVEQTGARPGQTILISGGAGAVGNYAIQIAKQKGLRVLTTVSTDAKADFARAAGADEVINYKTDDIGLRVMQ